MLDVAEFGADFAPTGDIAIMVADLAVTYTSEASDSGEDDEYRRLICNMASKFGI